jgi:hypothetical protein
MGSNGLFQGGGGVCWEVSSSSWFEQGGGIRWRSRVLVSSKSLFQGGGGVCCEVPVLVRLSPTSFTSFYCHLQLRGPPSTSLDPYILNV